MKLSGAHAVLIVSSLLGQLLSASELRAEIPNVFFAPPVNLSRNPQNALAYSVRAALDTKGNIHVLWADNNCLTVWPYTCTWHLFYRRSVDGGGTFSGPREISNLPSGHPLFRPQLAVDGGGNINVVWESVVSGSWEIFYSRSVDGGATFSTPKVISNYAGAAVDPQLAVDRLGNLNVVWQTQQAADLNRWNVWFSRSTDGGRSFRDPQPMCDDAAICNWPQIAVEPGGSIDVVWAEADCADCAYDVFFRRSRDGGATFSAAQNLSNSTESLITVPEIVADSSGNLNVVWSKGNYWSSGNADVFFTRSADAGSTFSKRNLSSNPGLSYFPQVGVDPFGYINVVWLDEAMGGIAFSRSVNGGADFSTPKNVLPAPDGSSEDPFVTVADGNINLVWAKGRGVFFSRSSDGGATFSVPQSLSENGGGAFLPQIIANTSGHICVLWFDDTSGVADVFLGRGVTLKAVHIDIAALPPSAFKKANASHRRPMLNALAEAEQASENGNRALAASILEDLLWHVNGCGAAADNNDWIADCEAQRKIRTSIEIIVAGLRSGQPVEQTRRQRATGL